MMPDRYQPRQYGESMSELINDVQWPADAEFWSNATEADITHYLDAGADPVAFLDGYADGPLHAAVRTGNVEAYRALNSAAPGHIETRNALGDTLLQIATMTGSVEMMRAVLEDGADLWAQRPAETTEDYYHVPVPVLGDGQVKGVGESVDAQQWQGETALHIAVYARDMDAVKFLLDVGAAEKDFRNSFCESLLHWAVLQGDVELTKALIAGGIDIKACNVYDETALHYAARLEEHDIGQVLIDAGDDGERAMNAWGQTPIDIHSRALGASHGAESNQAHVLSDESLSAYEERLNETRDASTPAHR